MSEPKTAEVKFEDAIVRDIAEQLGASIAGLGFPVGMGTAPPEEMCRRAARGIVALYGRQLSSAASASPPAETGEGSVPANVKKLLSFIEWALENDQPVNPEHIVALSDAVKDAYRTHPASDQSDTERMRAALEWAKDRLFWHQDLTGVDRMAAALAEKAAGK